MSLNVGSNPIASVYYGNNEIIEIYKGSDLIWAGYSDAPTYIFRDIDSNGKLTLATGSLESANSIKRLKDYALEYAFYNCANLSGTVTFSNLKNLNKSYILYRAFYGCSGITSVVFSQLENISGSYAVSECFKNCTSLTSVSFPELKRLSGSYMGRYMLEGCSSLTSITFPKLSYLNNMVFSNFFKNCTSLRSVSFPALTASSFGTTNVFNDMLTGVTGCTVHFPSNLQSVIGAWTSVTSGFGGSNTTVLFDL